MGRKVLVPLILSMFLGVPAAQAFQAYHHTDDPRECFQKDTPECNAHRAAYDRSRNPDEDGD